MEEAAPAAISGYTTSFNVHPIDHGQQFSPGGPDDRILMPFEMTEATWAAYHGGPKTWKTYLDEIEGQLTAKSFARLSRVVAPDRDKLPLDASPSLRLVHSEPATEARSSEQLLTELRDLAGRMEVEAKDVATLTPEEELTLIELRNAANVVKPEMLSPGLAQVHAELCDVADKMLLRYGLEPTCVGD